MEYRKCLQGFLERLGDKIAGLLLYGSAVRKEKPRDIDILVLLDDSASELDVVKVKSELSELEKRFREMGLTLHYQPPKLLSQIWLLILKAEPWIITAFEQGIPIYQKDKVIDQMKEIVESIAFVFEERAERLIERARKGLLDIREFKKKMFLNIADAVIDMAQLLLFLDRKAIFDKKRIIEELKNSYSTLLGRHIDDFIDICIIYDKIIEAKLSDLSMEEIEHYFKKGKQFLERVQKIISMKIGEDIGGI